ncbi:hypothetical protein FACS1894186_5790 [Alphaproteobacteria bacterium]|nr:hypothetical protein FACS1894186_5790 [Alphaproteobacteria bacterium]
MTTTPTCREEWLAARQNGLGGSDAACVLGANPYRTNVELWEDKAGLRLSADLSDNPAVQYGIAAEGPLRRLFALDYPRFLLRYEEFDLRRDPEHPELLATLDGELADDLTGARGTLEIKTATLQSAQARKAWADGSVPQSYYCQVLHNMAVCRHEFAYLRALLIFPAFGDVPERREIRDYRFDARDAQVKVDTEFLRNAEIAFWRDYVVPNRKPPLILPEL